MIAVLPERRAQIIAEARAWVGTPYRHLAGAAPLKGVACDCLGLLRAVFKAVVGRELEIPQTYSPDWAEATGEEVFLDGARRQLIEIPVPSATAGDLLLFRWRAGVPVKHCAFLVEGGMAEGTPRVAHAYDGAGKVAEVNLAPAWRARVAAAFSLPDA